MARSLDVVERVHGHAVHFNLEVQVRAERVARVAYEPDVLPPRHLVAGAHKRGAGVHVLRDDAVAVRDDDPVAGAAVIPAVVCRGDNGARSGGKIRSALGRGDVEALVEVRKKANRLTDMSERAYAYSTQVMDAMSRVRASADQLEMLVDDALWPLPKYRELLFF